MKDNEVIRALKVCIKEDFCNGCPLHEVQCEGGCQHYLRVQALKIINLRKREANGYRYKAKTQKGELARLYKQNAEQKAEIERLEKILDKRCDTCPAVRTTLNKFAIRLKEKATGTFYEERKYVDTEDIDDTLEEMVSDKEKE